MFFHRAMLKKSEVNQLICSVKWFFTVEIFGSIRSMNWIPLIKYCFSTNENVKALLQMKSLFFRSNFNLEYQIRFYIFQ